MERISHAERFEDRGGVSEVEAPADAGMEFGGAHLSFSELEPVETKKWERAEGESEEDYNDRSFPKDERLFVAAMLAAEGGDDEKAKWAFSQDDFKRMKRTQRREFLDAVANMSLEEYGARVDHLQEFYPVESKEFDRITQVAESIREAAERRAEMNAAPEEAPVNMPEEAPIERSYHRPEREFGVRRGVEFRELNPEEISGFEPRRPEIVTPQIETMNRVLDMQAYREEKQKRRSRSFFGRLKERVSRAVDRGRAFLRPVEQEGFNRPVNGFFEEPLERGEEDFVAERPENGFFEQPLPDNIAGRPRPENGWFATNEHGSDYGYLAEDLPEEASYVFDEPSSFTASWRPDDYEEVNRRNPRRRRRAA